MTSLHLYDVLVPQSREIICGKVATPFIKSFLLFDIRNIGKCGVDRELEFTPYQTDDGGHH